MEKVSISDYRYLNIFLGETGGRQEMLGKGGHAKRTQFRIQSTNPCLKKPKPNPLLGYLVVFIARKEKPYNK